MLAGVTPDEIGFMDGASAICWGPADSVVASSRGNRYQSAELLFTCYHSGRIMFWERYGRGPLIVIKGGISGEVASITCVDKGSKAHLLMSSTLGSVQLYTVLSIESLGLTIGAARGSAW